MDTLLKNEKTKQIHLLWTVKYQRSITYTKCASLSHSIVPQNDHTHNKFGCPVWEHHTRNAQRRLLVPWQNSTWTRFDLATAKSSTNTCNLLTSAFTAQYLHQMFLFVFIYFYFLFIILNINTLWYIS